MRWLRLCYPRVLVWLILAFTSTGLSARPVGFVPAGHSLAIPAADTTPLPIALSASLRTSFAQAPSNTPTATPVASTTPTVTLMPTFTPTPTRTPLPTIEPQPLPEVRIALAATPEEVHPGEVLTYTIHLTNTGPVRATSLTISDSLPAGLVYVPGSAGSGQYDPPTRHLTWSLAALEPGTEATFRFQARAVPAAPNPILNTAEVSSPELPSRPTATASVHVRHAAEWLVLPDAATHLAAPGGRVTLEVPAGAVAEPARFTYRSLAAHPLAADRTRLVLQFELTALPSAAGEPVMQFQKPLRLTVDLTDLVDIDSLKPGEALFVGYQEAATGQWRPLPLIAYQPGPVLSVELDHFTLLGAGTDHEYESGWVLAFNEAQVSLFDGGFTYNYPIAVPPGRGGLQPGLNLSYNSRRVDGTLSWIQTDWAGLGWSVDTVEIVRKLTIHNYPEDAQHWKWGTTSYENEFTLLFNGTGYDLKPAALGQFYGRYHTADEQFLYIERRNAPWCANKGGCTSQEQAINDTSEYWIIKAKDGTEYRLGYNTDSAQVATGIGSYTWPVGESPPQDSWYAGEVRNRVVFRWRLDQIRDPSGNRIEFRYDEERLGYDTEPPADRDRASYLREVCYNQIVVNGEERCGSRVFFVHEPRGTAPDSVADYQADGPQKFYFYQRDYLRSIQVQFWNTETLTHAILSEYAFAYAERTEPTGEHDNHTRRLQSITAYGRGGEAGGQALPATTFSYEVHRNKGQTCTSNCTLWHLEPFGYERLSEVHNGYGGVITATYQTPDQWDAQYELAWNYRAAQRWTKERGAVVNQVDYTYPGDIADRCYEDPLAEGQCKDPASFAGGHTGGQLVGYTWTEERLKDGSGVPVAQTRHIFWLNSGKISPTFALGREIETRYADPNGTVLRTVQRTYSDDTAGRPAGVHFIRLDRVDSYAGDTSTPHTRTDYSYDAYGNTTRVIAYGADMTGDERTTHRQYVPNPTAWIVDRVARETVYAGLHPSDDDDPNTLKARTRYHYDLLDPADPLAEPQPQAWTSEPTQGLLTQVDAWNGGLAGNDSDYSLTGYRYDDFGNPIRTTDPLSRTTTTDYDTLFDTYPVTVTNALGHTTITRYYGVNGAPATGEGAFFGQVEAVTDPNGATTTYAYDVFGRLETVRRPGDEAPAPATVQYTYVDNPPPVALPLRVQVDRRQDASTVRTSHRFYDGLGRLIETKTPLPDSQQAVQHTTYDAQGLVADEYIPYYTTAIGSAYVAVDTSKPKTSYTYDALGRVKQVTHPDDTGTTYAYGVERNDADSDFAGGREVVYVVDANQHFVRRSLDAYGRLETVSEATSTYPNWGQEHRTRYAYDVQDHLTQVTDTAGHTTDIDYDPLGHKTRMVDPDMGEWTYGYDAAGNLTKQRDARNQATCFYYDALDRLRGKSYHAGVVGLDSLACPGTSGVHYSYDAGAYGVGRRTGMGDASGTTTWGYDARGRVVTEARRIGALGTYTTSYSYDSLDRPVSMRYPDPTPDAVETGEVITTTYNIAGQPATLSSSLEGGAIGQMSYNAQGQPKLITHTTASLVTHFGYYGYNHRGIGDSDDAPNQSWAEGHVGRLWKLCTVPAGVACPQTGSGSSVLDLRYAYDNVGNVTTLREKTNNDQLQQFRYDALDRLTQAWTEPADVGMGDYITRTYAYNSIGNITAFDGVTYGYGQASGIAPGAKPHAVTHVGGVETYGYDENGNMTGHDGDTLTYDAENRLWSVTTSGETVTFTYDGDGRRVLRDTDTDTIAYVGPHYELRFDKQPMPEDLDGDCVVTVIDIMRVAAQWGAQGPGIPEDVNGDQVVDVGDVQQVAGKWRETCHALAETVKYYTLGGQRIAMRKAGTLYYLFTDHLGSTSVSYRSDGGDTRTQRYYPWGTIRPGPDNALSTDRTFTGQKLDESTGLLYYSDSTSYGRYYDPALSRWTQPDPIVPEPSNPQSLNRYSYVFNNPVRYSDPSGRCPWCIAAGIAILKGIDYGWTAWDVYQSNRTLNDPNASNLDRQLAELNIILALSLEGAEPDDVLPVSVPADDVARRGLIRTAREALAAGDETALRNLPDWMRPIVRGLVTQDKVLDALGYAKNWRKLEGVVDNKIVKTVPDFVDDTNKIVGEVKDVAALGWEKQIRAQYDWASSHGYTYQLIIRRDTVLRGELKELVRRELIEVDYIERILR